MNLKTTNTVQHVITIPSERDTLLSSSCDGAIAFELRSQQARVANVRHSGVTFAAGTRCKRAP